jgi:hypothetical protein
MKWDAADLKMKLALVATMLIALAVVLLELYAEAILVVCLSLVWYTLHRKFPRNATKVSWAFFIITPMLVYAFNRWITHSIVIENRSAYRISFLSVSTGSGGHFTLQGIPSGYRVYLRHRDIFCDGHYQINGDFADGSLIDINSDFEGNFEGSYWNEIRCILKPDGKTEVQQGISLVPFQRAFSREKL